MIEVLEAFYMTNIITNYFVEYRVTILKSSRVDWYHKYTGLKDIYVINKQAVSLRYTRDDDIGILEEFFCVVRYCKMKVI